ncbi:efflux RND transporter periplasmic adaptor subunit [Alteromonas sp. a30]|uniref:efflux RND transporter periplasmic adaptor subunit n=1 Tax=Alteromonas sp. a30 TaxID=2730917 RepID=UPI00227DC67C|nr:efflux RND transporter periplasmic adaptor subunit [Alteromonas sp. a30]MCY7296151.1 efflux RND transporter periplasmic adaptor subunit [Alteromonas sp. a30]
MNENLLKIGAPFVVLALGIIISIGLVKANAKDNELQQELPAPLVSVEKVQPENYQVNIDSWGEVQPKERTNLSSFVNGEIVAVHEDFYAGGLVKAGEVLVRVDESDYRAALIEAESSLAAAQSELEQEIALGEVAKEEWASVAKEKVSALALRKPQLLSAKARLKAAEAAYTRAKRNLERCQIKAPYDALIVSRNVGIGQVVNSGTAVAELFSIENAEVVLPIAGFDAPFIPKDIQSAPARLTVADKSQLSRDIYIDRDLGVVNQATRMSNLVAVIEDPYGLRSNVPVVKFGSYVKVTVPGVTLNGVISASQEVLEDDHVWIVDANDKLVQKKVSILREEKGLVLIGSGLEAGERLVTQIPEYPQDGMVVSISSASTDNEVK